MSNANKLILDLQSLASEKRKKSNEWFFKTGKGEYGEGDTFIGISMPDIRKVIKDYQTLDFKKIKKLFKSPIHEARMAGVLILTENAKKAFKKKDLNTHKKIVDFYLKNRYGVNNWDLVDASAHYILGASILNGINSLDILEELSNSNVMWDRRIAMVSTWIIIRSGDVYPTITLAKQLLDNKEDLMHKAVGWMLREAWKKEPEIIEDFIMENYHQIPRTALRYSIEKMEETKRKSFLNMYKS